MSKKVITFGTWEGKPIEWLTLKKTELYTMYLSDKIICNNSFNLNESDSNNYETSNIHKWLNTEFYNGAFTTNETKNMVNNKNDSAKGFVFLLSKEEAEELLNDTTRNLNCNYLLRTAHPSKNSSIWFINNNSFDYYNGYKINQVMGVRPVIYILNEEYR